MSRSEWPDGRSHVQAPGEGGAESWDSGQFLELSSEQAAYVELKLALNCKRREKRTEQGLSQAAVARRLGSSQSPVAKIEASDPSASLDLLVRGLLALGSSRKELGVTIAKDRQSAA